MKTSKILALATTLVIFGGVACNKPEAKPVAAEDDAAKKAAEEAARKAAEEAAAKKAAEEEAARKAAEEAARRKMEEAKKAEAEKMAAFKRDLEAATKDINFDFDKSDIREADKAKLELLATFLRNNGTVKIRIEGHCDERGTNEYNIALGNRRAAATLAYLKALGVAEDRFETVSFGKEKPKVTGHDEESWFANRRCEFKML